MCCDTLIITLENTIKTIILLYQQVNGLKPGFPQYRPRIFISNAYEAHFDPIL